jgi:hypothetical protein
MLVTQSFKMRFDVYFILIRTLSDAVASVTQHKHQGLDDGLGGSGERYPGGSSTQQHLRDRLTILVEITRRFSG